MLKKQNPQNGDFWQIFTLFHALGVGAGEGVEARRAGAGPALARARHSPADGGSARGAGGVTLREAGCSEGKGAGAGRCPSAPQRSQPPQTFKATIKTVPHRSL